MRTVVGAALLGLSVVAVVACSSSGASVDPTTPIELPFGPYTIAPGDEVDDQCVQISLHNEDYLFVI